MAVSETVERSVRLDGPCSSWFPLAQDSLAASGFQEVAADAAQRRLTARYGDSRIGGRVTVTHGPSSRTRRSTDSHTAIATPPMNLQPHYLHFPPPRTHWKEAAFCFSH